MQLVAMQQAENFFYWGGKGDNQLYFNISLELVRGKTSGSRWQVRQLFDKERQLDLQNVSIEITLLRLPYNNNTFWFIIVSSDMYKLAD